MKKKLAILLAGVLVLSTFLMGCGEKKSSDGTYKPTSTINWTVTSGPGGGSDIFTRMIADIMTKEKIVDQTIIITNKTDGNGEIGRNEVAHLKGGKVDSSLITFNSGDLMPMVVNTKNRASDFTILAIMAVDKQLIYKGTSTKYEDFAEAIDAAKNGTKVIIGGSKGDDVATYEAMLEEIGVQKADMSYITYDSTGDAITAALGGHIEFVISKPAAASEYVTAGSLIPVLALANERYVGNLSNAPTLSEIGDYDNVEVPIWRGVAAPGSMSEEAVAFWTDALKQVSESQQWQTDYIEKNKLIADFMNAATATEYVRQYEKAYMEENGIK